MSSASSSGYDLGLDPQEVDHPTVRDEQTLIDACAELLRTHGPDEPVTSGEVATRLGITDGSGNSRARRLIKVTMDARDLPVRGTSNGYYVIQTTEQLEDALDDLDARIDGIQDRKEMLVEAFKSERFFVDDRALDAGDSDDATDADDVDEGSR